ncbi:MAG: radical SAM protein [Promethearchaeota archaeon]
MALVYPNMFGEFFPSIGLTYLGTVLQEEHDVKVLDLTATGKNWPAVVRRFISKFSPRVVGLSSLTFNHYWAVKVAHLVKQVDPSVLVVFGGVHSMISPRSVLEQPPVDVVCTGEGELAFPELLQEVTDGNREFPGVRGFYYKGRDGKIHENPPAPLVEDLDALPFPNWDLWRVDKYLHFQHAQGELPMLGSRGCVYDCSFCSNHRLRQVLCGKYLRVRSPKNVVAEVEYQRQKYGKRFSNVYFWDENFLGGSKRAFREFCELYRVKGLHRKVIWSCNIRADRVDLDWAKTARRAGCFYVRFGVESGNDFIRNRVLNKNLSEEAVFKARKALEEADVLLRVNMMLGVPGESSNTLRESVSFVKRLKPDNYFFSLYQPLPGTRLLELIPRLGGEVEEERWRENFDFWMKSIVRTRYLSPKQLVNFRRRVYLGAMASFFFEGLRARHLRFLRDAFYFLKHWHLENKIDLIKLATFTILRYKFEDWKRRYVSELLREDRTLSGSRK